MVLWTVGFLQLQIAFCWQAIVAHPDQGKMRLHLVDCIENLKLQMFPRKHCNYGDDVSILLMHDLMFWLHTDLYN